MLRKEIQLFLGKTTINKIEKRLFEKYGITLTESMEDFTKFEEILKEIFGGGTRGMLRSIINNLCNLKKNEGRKDSFVTLYDPRMTEKILEMLGDRSYRKILDLLIDKSLTSYEILDEVEIPQASTYRKIESLMNAGLLVENGRVADKSGRPAVKITTIYRGLDMKILKGRATIQVKISKKMLHKSTILSAHR